MPVVNRQNKPAPPKQAPLGPPGSLLACAVPVTDLREERVKVTIYGRNRSGKTTLACQFPKPLLLISSEPDANGGATSVGDHKGVVLQRVSYKFLGQDAQGRWFDATDMRCVRKDNVKGAEKLVALAKELRGDHPFATVVLDTATSMQDIILSEIMGWDKVPDMLSVGAVSKDTYQYRADRWRDAMRPLLDLSTCHVVVLAQEKDHNPPSDDFGGKRKILGTMQQGSFMAPALGATNAQWLQDACGYVLHIYEDELMQEITVPMMDPMGKPMPPSIQRVGTGKRQRHLRLLYHPNFAAGGRWQFNRDMPEFVTAPTPSELYRAIARYIPSLV